MNLSRASWGGSTSLGTLLKFCLSLILPALGGGARETTNTSSNTDNQLGMVWPESLEGLVFTESMEAQRASGQGSPISPGDSTYKVGQSPV